MNRERTRYRASIAASTGGSPPVNYFTDNADTNQYFVDNACASAYQFSGGVNVNVLNGTERNVAKGGLIPTNLVSNSTLKFTRAERRSRVLLGGQPVKSIRFVYFNGFVSRGEKPNTNPITIECGLERIDVTPQTVLATFNGLPNITINPGEWAYTDPIYPASFGLSTFPANWDARCRTGVTIKFSGFETWPVPFVANYETISGIAYCVSNSPTSQIGNTGALVTPSGGTSNQFPMGPVSIIGEWAGTPDVSVMLEGDSIDMIVNDSQDNGTIGGGFLTRGVRSVSGRSIANSKTARSGEFASDWAGQSSFRTWLMQFHTHFVTNIGTNDIGSTVPTIVANIQVVFADFKANGAGPKYLISIPIGPRCTSSDSFVTLVNQNYVGGYEIGGKRDQVNAAILATLGTAGGPDEILDMSTLVFEDQTVHGKWVVNGTTTYATSDGLHPQSTIQGLAGTFVAAAAALWTP